MLGLSSITQRIEELEQTVQRGAKQPLQPQSIPALPDASAVAGSSSGAAAAPAAHSNVLSKLRELSTAFQHILSQDPTVHQYMARAADIEALVESHASAASGMHVGLSAASLLRQEEGVVLSAAESMESAAAMLQDLHALLPILDQKWPLDDFASLQRRVEAVQSIVPRQAFAAAQTAVAFETFLAAYHSLLDVLSRQFLLWNQQLTQIEEEIDAKIARKQQQQ